MKIAMSALVLAAFAGSASASLLDLTPADSRLTLNRTLPLGERWQNVDRGAVGFVYDNLANFGGSGVTNGGAAGGITSLLADDLSLDASAVGEHVIAVQFNVANFNTAATAARPRIRIYAADGASGGPGTLITGASFNPIVFAGGSVATFTWAAAPNTFLWPIANAASLNIWAGIVFDNVGTATTNAQLNNLGMGVFDPPVVGTSADNGFGTFGAGSFFVNNPAGSQFNFGGNPVVNLGWSVIVPAPGSMALLGLGGLLAARRRR